MRRSVPSGPLRSPPFSRIARIASILQSWNRYSYVLNNPLANVDSLGLHDDCGGPCSGFSYQEDGCTVIVSYYVDDIGYDEPLISTYCPAGGPVAVSSGGGGRGGKTQQSAPNKNLVKGACLADVALNFGVGFIPGVNGAKLVADLAGVNLHPFQSAVDGSSVVTAGPGLSTLSGFADIGRDIAHIAYGSAGGTVGLARASDLVSRASFAGKTASQQAKLLGEVGEMSKLAKMASAAGGVANLLNAASSLSDAYDCIK